MKTLNHVFAGTATNRELAIVFVPLFVAILALVIAFGHLPKY